MNEEIINKSDFPINASQIILELETRNKELQKENDQQKETISKLKCLNNELIKKYKQTQEDCKRISIESEKQQKENYELFQKFKQLMNANEKLFNENKEQNKEIIKYKSQHEINENETKKIEEIIKQNHDKCFYLNYLNLIDSNPDLFDNDNEVIYLINTIQDCKFDIESNNNHISLLENIFSLEHKIESSLIVMVEKAKKLSEEYKKKLDDNEKIILEMKINQTEEIDKEEIINTITTLNNKLEETECLRKKLFKERNELKRSNNRYKRLHQELKDKSD